MKNIASNKKIKPDIYNISIEDYHRGPGISRSGLMEFKRSPYHYWYKYLNPDYQPESPTPAQILGNAFHTYLLEPNEFNKRYFVIPEFNKVTKEGKARWETIKAEIGYKQTLSSNQYQVLQAMAESFYKHELASQFLKKAKIEQSIYWIDPETNVLCTSESLYSRKILAVVSPKFVRITRLILGPDSSGVRHALAHSGLCAVATTMT